MFNRLPESNAKRQRRTGGLVVSTVLHLVIIALAVRASGLKAAPGPKAQPIPTIYVAPKPAPPRETPRPIQPSTNGPRVLGPVLLPLPPVIGDIPPTTIPEPGAMANLIGELFNPTRVSARTGSDGSPVGNGPLPEYMVENPVVAIPGTATPRYPAMLQSAGLEGSVRAQFVVDTLGRVEQGSFKVLESTHDLFAAAVRDAMNRARFKPAEVGGRRVRQLVEQSFTFSITR